MLNYVWAGMILFGVLVAVFTGKIPDLTMAVIDSSKEAVTVCVAMAGVMSMWTGLMKIAENSGLIKLLSKNAGKALKPLFPDIPRESRAMEYISTNIIANILGLGWAATPAGLKAMSELQKMNGGKTSASRSMCMFMIINMSSLQLISVNLIAYRSQYSSARPSEIIGPGLLATLVSTVAAVFFAKVMERRAFR